MHNYRIHCDIQDRTEVLTILRKYNDVVIDNVDSHSIGVTIEGDNAREIYEALLREIDHEVFRHRRHRPAKARV